MDWRDLKGEKRQDKWCRVFCCQLCVAGHTARFALFIIAVYAVHQNPHNRAPNKHETSLDRRSQPSCWVGGFSIHQTLIKDSVCARVKKKQNKRRLLNRESIRLFHYNMLRGLLPAASLSDYDFHPSLLYEVSAKRKASNFRTLQNYAAKRTKLCYV